MWPLGELHIRNLVLEMDTSHCMRAKLLQSCLTLCNSVVTCQAPLSVGILQARILEWVAMPTSRGSS